MTAQGRKNQFAASGSSRWPGHRRGVAEPLDGLAV